MESIASLPRARQGKTFFLPSHTRGSKTSKKKKKKRTADDDELLLARISLRCSGERRKKKMMRKCSLQKSEWIHWTFSFAVCSCQWPDRFSSLLERSRCPFPFNSSSRNQTGCTILFTLADNYNCFYKNRRCLFVLKCPRFKTLSENVLQDCNLQHYKKKETKDVMLSSLEKGIQTRHNVESIAQQKSTFSSTYKLGKGYL